MPNQKNIDGTSIRKSKTIQELQLNKTRKCGAYKPSKPRRLKIQPKHIQYTWSNSIVPQILLQGEWLRKTGFEYNEHVIITQEKGKLIIEIER